MSISEKKDRTDNKEHQGYSPGLFVGRKKEISQVTSLLIQSQPRVRAVVFEGPQGSGKNWFLQHLHKKIIPSNRS